MKLNMPPSQAHKKVLQIKKRKVFSANGQTDDQANTKKKININNQQNQNQRTQKIRNTGIFLEEQQPKLPNKTCWEVIKFIFAIRTMKIQPEGFQKSIQANQRFKITNISNNLEDQNQLNPVTEYLVENGLCQIAEEQQYYQTTQKDDKSKQYFSSQMLTTQQYIDQDKEKDNYLFTQDPYQDQYTRHETKQNKDLSIKKTIDFNQNISSFKNNIDDENDIDEESNTNHQEDSDSPQNNPKQIAIVKNQTYLQKQQQFFEFKKKKFFSLTNLFSKNSSNNIFQNHQLQQNVSSIL